MPNPLVSVIIPAYNGADFLGAAIKSVLNQTYQNFELIIVDDVSTDRTAEIVRGLDDFRIKYIRHSRNQGASTARRTGCHNSSGEIVAFLDQDDLFHPEKLETHVSFLEEHPDVGFSYNPYFELVQSSESIRTVWQPPKEISLGELTLGFYLPPSSWVIRRNWALLEDVWDQHLSLRGREILVCSRLYMSGCKFARVDKVLHYRRYHAHRKIGNLQTKCESELTCQEIVFSDARCPPDALALRPIAKTSIYLMWANVAFSQDETALGHTFVQEALRLIPALIEGNPCPLVSFMMGYAIDDESHDYEVLLKRLFCQFPKEILDVSTQYDWALSRGYLIRAVRALIWDRTEDARRYFARAAELNVEIDESFVQPLTHELLGYELQFGNFSVLEKLHHLCTSMEQIGNKVSARRLKGSYLINRAFDKYHSGEFGTVPVSVAQAVINNLTLLANRGVWSILIRSILRRGRKVQRERILYGKRLGMKGIHNGQSGQGKIP